MPLPNPPERKPAALKTSLCHGKNDTVDCTPWQKEFLDLNNILCQKLNTSHYNVVTGSIILELAYQKDHLSLIISACPVRSGCREGTLRVPSDGKLHLAGPRRWWPCLPCHTRLVEFSPSSISSIPLNILQVPQHLVMLSGLEVPGNGYFVIALFLQLISSSLVLCAFFEVIF